MLKHKKHGPPPRPFTHTSDCVIVRTDPGYEPPWQEIESGSWKRECQSTAEYWHAPHVDDRVRLDPLHRRPPDTSGHASTRTRSIPCSSGRSCALGTIQNGATGSWRQHLWIRLAGPALRGGGGLIGRAYRHGRVPHERRSTHRSTLSRLHRRGCSVAAQGASDARGETLPLVRSEGLATTLIDLLLASPGDLRDDAGRQGIFGVNRTVPLPVARLAISFAAGLESGARELP